jgi:hypothetical protein
MCNCKKGSLKRTYENVQQLAINYAKVNNCKVAIFENKQRNEIDFMEYEIAISKKINILKIVG